MNRESSPIFYDPMESSSARRHHAVVITDSLGEGKIPVVLHMTGHTQKDLEEAEDLAAIYEIDSEAKLSKKVAVTTIAEQQVIDHVLFPGDPDLPAATKMHQGTPTKRYIHGQTDHKVHIIVSKLADAE